MSTSALEVNLDSATALVLEQKVELVEEGSRSYGQILRSSALIGGSSAITILLGMVRTKVLAIFLGPGGFGLLSIYSSVILLAQTFAGMGINSSGVRQIAEAVGLSEVERVATTTIVLRRMSLVTGLFGAALMLLCARQISLVSFGNANHARAIAALSVAVCFALLAAGQGALLQGSRRIADLAKMNMLGSALGTAASIALVYILRSRGVVLSLIAMALMTAFASWWYSRRVQVGTALAIRGSFFGEASALLKLGFAFMSSGLMTLGVAYVIRVIVLRKLGIVATGLYQSSWTLGGLYVGFILQAMGADFYPRLTAQIKSPTASNRLVNEQAQVGLLLAGPGVIATLTFAPLVIALFYSAQFQPAVSVLRWICLGTIIQVVTWPMGFILVAQARQVLFISCELAWTLVSLGFAWTCVDRFGLSGAGIAFFSSYIFHGVMIYAVVHRINGFRWSPANRRTGLLFLGIIAFSFISFYRLPFAMAEAIGMTMVLGASTYSIWTLAHLVAPDQIPAPVRRLLSVLGLFSHRAALG